MSLGIAVAHTGQRLDADPVAFSSVDALKHWISRATDIPPETQILLTLSGKHVKLQALLTEVGICFQLMCYRADRLNHRRRSLSTIATSRMERRLPYSPYLFQMHTSQMTLPTLSRTTPICEHGRHFSRPAATGPLQSSRSRTPCPG